MYHLAYKKSALKALRKMPKPQADKLHKALKAVAEAPHQATGNWKPMQGQPYWRLRQGSYRAICHLDDGALTVLVLKAGPRGDVYK